MITENRTSSKDKQGDIFFTDNLPIADSFANPLCSLGLSFFASPFEILTPALFIFTIDCHS